MSRPVFLIVLLFTLLLGRVVLGAAQPQDSIDGEWVGAFELGEDLVYVRVQFKTEAQGIKLTVISMTPGTPGTVADARLEWNRIHFELSGTPEKLVFEGELQGNDVRGAVGRAGKRGTFQLVRTAQVDPKVYDQYAGAYELERDKIIFIRRRDVLKEDPPYSMARSWLYYLDESGRMGILYPSSETSFFSGPTYAVPVPVELRVRFIRDRGGHVNGLVWHKSDLPEMFAKRSKLYREEEVHFANRDIAFAGRLLVPATKGPHPAVVLATGWRATNRNSPLDALADVLARHGIAALVYDKRGTGASGGDWRKSSFLRSLADDVLAALQYLRSRKDINPGQVGVFGSSWTAVVTSLAASRSKDVAFMIIVSAPGLSLGERYLMGLERYLRANGFSEEDIRDAVAFANLEVEFSRTGEGWEKLEAAADRVRTRKWFSHTWTVTLGAGSKDHWFWREQRRSSVDDHPVSLLKKVTCPVLAVYGESDSLVPPADNKALVEKGLREGGNKDYTIKMFPKGEHGLWQVEASGAAGAKTYVSGYLETMTEWLIKRVDVPR